MSLFVGWIRDGMEARLVHSLSPFVPLLQTRICTVRAGLPSTTIHLTQQPGQ